MPLGTVSGVGHGMGVVDGVHVPQAEGAVLGVWYPHSVERFYVDVGRIIDNFHFSTAPTGTMDVNISS